jgi:hypothetical protein
MVGSGNGRHDPPRGDAEEPVEHVIQILAQFKAQESEDESQFAQPL